MRRTEHNFSFTRNLTEIKADDNCFRSLKTKTYVRIWNRFSALHSRYKGEHFKQNNG